MYQNKISGGVGLGKGGWGGTDIQVPVRRKNIITKNQLHLTIINTCTCISEKNLK